MSTIKLYNTLTRQIDNFKPINKGLVKIYTCGPTVYDYLHIGNWYTYIRKDILIRLLQSQDFKVQWIINITDVGHLTDDQDNGEDKLQKKADATRQTAWQIANFYTENFLELWKALNLTNPTKFVKATEHINDQIDLIKQIEAKGYSYIINDGVYFDTSLFRDYAKFSQLDLDEQQASQRINQNLNKKNLADFALWKFSPKDKKRDMEWSSPWGIGFPGWHIECSAMSMKYLGSTFDIHTGGIDHIPVHHTNEIAQSMAVTNQPLANYWIHSNHVTVNGQKISKSLGNGLRLEDIIKQGFTYQDIRLHVLESHYRSQSRFSLDNLTNSHNRFLSWQEKIVLIYQNNLPDSTQPTVNFDQTKKEIINYLADDLNTPMVLKTIDQLFNQINYTNFKPSELKDFIKFLDQMLGFQLSSINDISSKNKDLIAQRSNYKKQFNWAEADKIRQHLSSQKIGLKDEPDQTYWYYL